MEFRPEEIQVVAEDSELIALCDRYLKANNKQVEDKAAFLYKFVEDVSVGEMRGTPLRDSCIGVMQAWVYNGETSWEDKLKLANANIDEVIAKYPNIKILRY